MATDREKFKQMQSGQFNANNSASDPIGEVNQVHRRTHHIQKVGTENAATNVAETGGCVIVRKSLLKEARLLTGTNAATDNTNYAVITIYKRTSAGASQTTLASWNTHGGGQGTITRYESENMSLTSNAANLVIAAGSVITYAVVKTGDGVAVGGDTVFSLDVEEI